MKMKKHLQFTCISETFKEKIMDVTYTELLHPDSTVIETLYWVDYGDGSADLYVRLRNGTLCGYSNVPLGVWHSFKLLAAENGSVGSYWNRFVKEHFAGLPTSDVTLLSADEMAAVDRITTAGDEPENELEQFPFAISFQRDFTEDDESIFSLMATSVEDAVNKFNEVAKIAGWGYDLLSVTQFFDW
jgi:hypothetical protein